MSSLAPSRAAVEETVMSMSASSQRPVVEESHTERKKSYQERIYATSGGSEMGMFQVFNQPPSNNVPCYQNADIFRAMMSAQLRVMDLEKDLAVKQERERATAVDNMCRLLFNRS